MKKYSYKDNDYIDMVVDTAETPKELVEENAEEKETVRFPEASAVPDPPKHLNPRTVFASPFG